MGSSPSRQGERLITRHEIDWPFQLGAVKVVPYVLGELGHWGEDIDGDQLNRAYYQAGVRASLPMWSVDPDGGKRPVERPRAGPQGRVRRWSSPIASRTGRITDLPLYDPLDDNKIEALRRRFATYTFGSP